MVTHVSYDQHLYRSSEECITGIRERIERGWRLCQLRGGYRGPYLAVFRKDDAS